MVTDHWSGHVDNVFAFAFVQRWYAVMKLHMHVPFCVHLYLSSTGACSSPHDVLCNCPMQVMLCSVPQPPLSGRDLKGFCRGRRGFSLRLLPNPLLQLNTIFLPNSLLQLNTTLLPNLMQLRATLPCPPQVNTIPVIDHCIYTNLKVRAVSDRIIWNCPELGSMPSFLCPVLQFFLVPCTPVLFCSMYSQVLVAVQASPLLKPS